MTSAKPSTPIGLSEIQIKKLEDRLTNWAAWLRMSGSGPVGCGSAERYYQPPRPDGEALVAAVRYHSIDQVDAELVDRAVVALKSNAHRAYLQMTFKGARSDKYISSVLKVSIDRMESLHLHVLCVFKLELSRIEKPVLLIRRGAPIWSGIAR